MDYKELAEKLRSAKWTNTGMTDDQSLEWDASDAITDLLARAEAAKARAKKAKRERDAEVDQLRGNCEKCVHYRVTWNGCTPDFECPLSDQCLNKDMWEWNGTREEE